QVFRPPDFLAGHLVERDHASAPAARRDDHAVAVNERRLADQPAGVVAAVLFQNILAPDRRAVERVQAGQVAVFGQRVDAVIVYSGRRARAIAAALAHLRPQSRRPDSLAVGAVQTKDHARVPGGSLHENAVAFDRKRAEAFAEARY